MYKDINGGNKEGGSFEPLANDKLRTNEPNLGVRTWLKPQQEKDGWQHGGGAVTGYFGFDPKTNLVYYGTGNPGVWNPDIRPGDNKWASSVFARDVDTGKAKWAMQTTPHDEASYGAQSEVVLLKHQSVTYATQVNENGFIYTWQADNGNLIAAKKVHPFVNWATGVGLKTGVPTKNNRFIKNKYKAITHICPNSFGAKSIRPSAYSPGTGLIYSPLIHMCGRHNLTTRVMEYFDPYDDKKSEGSSIATFPGPDGVSGMLAAYNPLTGKRKWFKREANPLNGGVLVTKGNLVVYGTVDRWLKVIDAKSGSNLWKFQLGSGVIGNAFSYGVKGKQYIGIYSGFGGKWAHYAKTTAPVNQKVTDTRMWSQERRLMLRTNFISSGAINIFSL